MATKNVQQIVDQFIADITEAIKGDAEQEVQEKLQEFAANFGEAPMKRKRTSRKGTQKKRKQLERPCPVPGCKGAAANRHQCVCKEHSESLERQEILLHKDNAVKPGGVWYKLGIGPFAKAEAKKAKTA